MRQLVSQNQAFVSLDTIHEKQWYSSLRMRLGESVMDNLLNPAKAHQQRCPRCQSPLNTVVVHGHKQCVICKSNIFECCSGDTCETDHNLAVGYKRG